MHECTHYESIYKCLGRKPMGLDDIACSHLYTTLIPCRVSLLACYLTHAGTSHALQCLCKVSQGITYIVFTFNHKFTVSLLHRVTGFHQHHKSSIELIQSSMLS